MPKKTFNEKLCQRDGVNDNKHYECQQPRPWHAWHAWHVPLAPEPVKTEEEHAQIMARIEQNKIIPRKCRAGMLPLSVLLYCSKCGRRMQFKRSQTKNGNYWTALCTYTYPDGRKCDQVGRKLDGFL